MITETTDEEIRDADLVAKVGTMELEDLMPLNSGCQEHMRTWRVFRYGMYFPRLL